MTANSEAVSAIPAQESVEPTPSHRWRWLWVPAIFTVPAVISAALYHTRYLQLGRETVLWKWLLDFQLAWYIWAALTPLILWLGRNVRVDRSRWLLPAATHFAIGSAFAIFQIALGVFFSILVYQEPTTWEYYVGQVVPTLFGRFPAQLIVYFLILGICYALDFQRQSRAQSLRAAQLEAELSRARLDTLQQQLQPHFLFNTLNSISVLMQKGQVEDANRVLNLLSDLLRSVLRKENTALVRLSEELEFVRRYVAIEQVRYGERLTVKFSIDPGTEELLIPTFMLQLLVENAIRHGVAKKSEAGRVTIKAERIGERLRLEVTDDGAGLAAADLKEGVGISNARRRLQHHFGADVRFDIGNVAAGGVSAVLEFPILAAEKS